MGNTYTLKSSKTGRETRKTRKPRKEQYDCYKKRLHVVVHTSTGTLSRYLGAAQICKLCYVSRSTAYRWLSQEEPIPRGMMELIQIKALGLIPDPEFEGFRVVDGDLWTPQDKRFNAQELEQFAFVCDQNRDYSRTIKELSTLKQQHPDALDAPPRHALPAFTGELPANVVDFKARAQAHAERRQKAAR